MAKQTYVINEFHGGLNSNSDPRDIQKGESPNVSASIDNLGKLRTIGAFDKGDASNNSTSTITHKHGLFVMGSDRQIDNSAADETLIFHYDFGTNIDVYDSDGWHASEITTPSSAKPVYYSADGVLRINDVNLGGLGRWYGYINRTVFASLGSSQAIDDWIDTNAYPATPAAGNCLISTPYKADDTTGPNSARGEYRGAIGSALLDTNAVNLRVGVASVSSVKTDGTAINATSDTAKVPNEAANYMTDYKNYTGGSSDTYANAEDVYPLFLDNNIMMGGKEGFNAYNGASNEVKDDGSVSNLSYTINDKKSVAVGVYFWQEELDRLDFITVQLGTDSSNYREWQVPSSKIAVGWNILVCEQGRHTSETGTPPIYGDSHVHFSITVTQINATNGNANTDVPKFYISGPVVVDNVGSVGYTEGTYSFAYTWLYDDTKQESMLFTMQDTDASDSYAKELNQVTIVGAPLLFNFDIYMNPKPSGTYGLDKRIIGSRIYYKKTDDDNYYLIGETNFIDKGFKFFPEAETYDYSFADVNDTTSNLDEAVVVLNITPESANVVDSWKSLNGFFQKVDTLEARWKTGVVQGRRAYIGNVQQDNVNYPDRMLKSMVNRFDTFPNKDSIVDVAVRDGESIVKLEAFADRILQFKEKTLYIINVAQNSEFLEHIHPFKGISHEFHSTKTDKGIAFFNEYGAYLYDGNNVIDLLERNGQVVISEDTWFDFIDASDNIALASVGYAPKKHQIVFMNKFADIYVYNLKLGSWHIGDNLMDYHDFDGRQVTKFGVNGSNEMFLIGGTKSQISKYTHVSSPTHDFTYTTKDIDFGDPSIRKKVYKVYITYRTGASNLPNVSCSFDTNGGTAYDKTFAAGTNYSEYFSGQTGSFFSLDPSTDWAVAELKPTTSSQSNNIKSFALKLAINTNIRSNTAQAGPTTTSITLDSGASAIDDYYNNMRIQTWSGTGLNQTARITDYNGSTKVATFTPGFSPAADSTTKFIVGLVPSGFEINDITIVYRMKSVK